MLLMWNKQKEKKKKNHDTHPPKFLQRYWKVSIISLFGQVITNWFFRNVPNLSNENILYSLNEKWKHENILFFMGFSKHTFHHEQLAETYQCN